MSKKANVKQQRNILTLRTDCFVGQGGNNYRITSLGLRDCKP